MIKNSVLIFTLLLFTVSAGAQIIVPKPLSVRQTGYTIDAVLDTGSKTVKGKIDAFWVNMSDEVVPTVQMHLYMNAFKNVNSTLNKEAGWFVKPSAHDPGWINLNKLTDRSGHDLINEVRFISPDDGNKNDQTVIQVNLPRPCNPKDTVFILAEFETKLPELTRRTGYNGDFYFVAQWFPKFGVYEPAGMRYARTGAWNCHQFHANSEFYSNHSLYEVKLTVPVEYTIGTCGVLMNEIRSETSKVKIMSYRAEDIVDFAWTAWPGYKIFTDTWKNVKITLLIPPNRLEQVERQFTSVKHALEYFDENVGPYPWPYLTIVDPPSKGDPAGGMEYTTMFTSASSYMMPRSIHMPEMVTIHEFGHAYFMGILASNEFEEPWLDEGINTFWEARITDHYYGENSGLIDHPFLQLSDKALARLSYVHSEGRQVVSNNEYSWNYPHHTYGMMSYNKTATWMYTLMGIVGEETINQIFREYYKRWAFRYPSGKDFVNTANEMVAKIPGNKFGADLNWFFDQTLYGTGICDYRVSAMNNLKIDSVGADSDDKDTRKAASETHLYKSVAELERTGEVMLPEEILIHFSDGTEVREAWDGKSRYKNFEYTGHRKIEWVKIDPDFRIRMDVNFINNSMTVNPDRIPAERLTNKLISFFQFFLNMILL